MFDLSRKTVIITGAGGHLGHAIATAFADAGATTVLVGRNRARLDAVRQAMTDPERCYIRPVDLTSSVAIDEFVAWTADRFDAIHGLVNNAYGGKVGPVSAITSQDFSDATALNLVAPFRLSRDLAPLLATGAGEHGSAIVNVGSMYGKVSPDPAIYGSTGTDNPAHYGAVKAGLIQLTRYLACNLDPRRIRVNSVSPGPFPNPANAGQPGFVTALSAKVPMARIGRPEEVAGPVLFLVSDAAAYVNGADIAVDGGWTAW